MPPGRVCVGGVPPAGRKPVATGGGVVPPGPSAAPPGTAPADIPPGTPPPPPGHCACHHPARKAPRDPPRHHAWRKPSWHPPAQARSPLAELGLVLSSCLGLRLRQICRRFGLPLACLELELGLFGCVFTLLSKVGLGCVWGKGRGEALCPSPSPPPLPPPPPRTCACAADVLTPLISFMISAV